MELSFPLVILALLIVVGLLVYESSRREDLKTKGDLSRRISGSSASATIAASGAEPILQQPNVSVPEFLRPLQRWLQQSGLELPVQQFLGLTLVAGVAGVLLTAMWLNFGIACFYGAGFAALPTVYILVRRKRRLSTFSQQLPYVADFMRSTLMAGHPLSRGLQMAAENAPEPMATELRLAIEQMRFGASLPDALESMFKRVPEESLAFFVAAVRVQAQVGSSLAEILDRVADAIRSRQRLQQQIKTLTAQARMSGLMVGAMPFFLLAVFTLLRPDYTGVLFYDPAGNKLLEAAIAMDLVALFIINRMVQV
ncbi:MAG: type II secretion system F family protein [Deltaproteobacteria bacterium]|nr:type II secretion system F family protein [Deltaproteobacteria bacterium]